MFVQNWGANVYSGFVHGCLKLETTQVLQLVDKYTSGCVQTMEHSSVITRKEPLRYKASGTNLRCILPSERRLCTKLHNLNRNYRGKSKIIGDRKIIGFQGLGVWGEVDHKGA